MDPRYDDPNYDPFSFLKGDDHDFNKSISGLDNMYVNMMEPGANQRKQQEEYQRQKLLKQQQEQLELQQQQQQQMMNAQGLILGVPVTEQIQFIQPQVMIPQVQYIQQSQQPVYVQLSESQQSGFEMQEFVKQPQQQPVYYYPNQPQPQYQQLPISSVTFQTMTPTYQGLPPQNPQNYNYGYPPN